MKRATAQVGTAAIVVAIAGYVAQVLAARFLGPADYTRFAVFWAGLFIIVGALSGIGQEVIRVSRVEKLLLDDGLIRGTERDHAPRIGIVAVTIGAGTAVVVFLTAFLWGLPAFGSDWLPTTVLLSLGAFLVGGSLAVGGMVAGLARWRIYSLLVMLEGVSRLALFVVAAFVMPTIFAL